MTTGKSSAASKSNRISTASMLLAGWLESASSPSCCSSSPISCSSSGFVFNDFSLCSVLVSLENDSLSGFSFSGDSFSSFSGDSFFSFSGDSFSAVDCSLSLKNKQCDKKKESENWLNWVWQEKQVNWRSSVRWHSYLLSTVYSGIWRGIYEIQTHCLWISW